MNGIKTTPNPIMVLFENGAYHIIPSRMISRYWEGEYHYVREPIPVDGYEFLEDTYGHWRAVRRTVQ